MDNPMKHVPEGAKYVGDAVSAITVLGALIEYLPALAALLTVVWTAIRIYETETVKGLFSRKKGGPDGADK